MLPNLAALSKKKSTDNASYMSTCKSYHYLNEATLSRNCVLISLTMFRIDIDLDNDSIMCYCLCNYQILQKELGFF